MGPTATGKTDLACEWMADWPFEIISIDSAMIYREMNIGTAKPTRDVLSHSPHHLIDICNPVESFSAAECRDAVNLLCDEILRRGKIPLLVGGTMMYFQALQQGLAQLPSADPMIRSELEKKAQEKGWAWMHHWLSQVDPITAQRVHAHDQQRIQRALEVFLITHHPLSILLASAKETPKFLFVNIGLMPNDRAWLHERIAQRFKIMLKQGLIEETLALQSKWKLLPSMPASRLVGYRQVFEYLQDPMGYGDLQDKGIFATRQLAKRQLTWLRHWRDLAVVAPDDMDFKVKIQAIVADKLENKR